VWFRDSTRREAERLGISGHAINLPNGSVEVLACGASDALAELEDWLRQGPPLASVTNLVVVVVEYRNTTGFSIG
jgi:acylphosphatase